MKDIFRFRGIDKLYCDMNGKFFFNDRPARIVYNNGSRSVLIGKTKKGLISLRKLAYKEKLTAGNCPF